MKKVQLWKNFTVKIVESSYLYWKLCTVKTFQPWRSILIYTENWVPRKIYRERCSTVKKSLKFWAVKINPWKYSDRETYKPWKVHDYEKSLSCKNSILKKVSPWKCSSVKNFQPWKSILNYGKYPRFWTVENLSPWKWSEIKLFYRENIQTWKINVKDVQPWKSILSYRNIKDFWNNISSGLA